MDVASYLQWFESSLTSYTGDDPLDPWVKFVENLEQRLPPGGGGGMSLVFDRLVQRFLNVEQYTNDLRYVNFCIKCASYYSDPIALYSCFFSKGVGTRTAALYVAWARQFEQRGMNEQADAVYQKALENQAHPASTVLHEYKQFQTRTRSETAVSGSRNPLQNSNLTNQMSHREPVTQNKQQVPVDGQSTCGPASKVIVTVSRSETSGTIPSSQSSSVQTVAEYTKEDLICEGSELCFEEARAQNYFRKLRQQQENALRQQQQQENALRQQQENALRQQQENALRQQQENALRQQQENALRQQQEQENTLRQQQENALRQQQENALRQQQENALRQQQENALRQEQENALQEHQQEEDALREEEIEEKDLTTIMLSKREEISKWLLEKVHHVLENQGGLTSQTSSHRLPVAETASSLSLGLTQPSFERPPPSNRLSSRRSLGLRLHSEPTFIREAAAVPEPRHQQRIDGTANILCSAVSHHPSVLADRGVGLQKSAASPLPTDQESVLQVSVVQPPSAQQPVSFETADLPLHRAACSSAVSVDVLSISDSGPPLELNATHQHAGQPAEPQEKLDVSQGATANLSHITPNNSLGFVQATPSRVLPSPTVNTREALGVIMDMFQAPTFLEEPFSSTSVLHAAEKESDAGVWTDGGASSFPKPPTTAAFTIFQDDDNKENSSAAAPAAAERSNAVRALAEISLSKADKPNETPPDLIPDESTMWGARYNSLNSLAACPNSTSDFAMLAQFVSTPFACKTFFSGDFFEDQENKCDDREADDEAYTRRQTKKLSPILEQSPSDEKLSETAVSQLVPSSARQGTIVGEGLAMAQHCLTTSSITMVQPPPPAVLSFRDQTICPADSSRTAGPGWEVYASPEQPPKQASFISVRPKSKPFKIMEDLENPASPQQVQNQVCDVPMSPECAPRPDWLAVRSPEATVEPDLDAFLSPRQSKNLDVPMSPEQPQLCADVPMSPAPISIVDEPMMSPDRGLRPSADVSMNADAPQTAPTVQLVSDPWDTDLISSLLSGLSPPLTAHPRCTTWQCNIPNITPKMTISMGKQSLRVDCILGEGAFATVYQATNPATLEKMVLKVQKPANPWEFYINTQLDARLQPDLRHLYGSMRSAHLFHDGSVLLGELHSYGTLLNAVNMYKSLSDKVMPQPLVMYFTICILHAVEQLHSVHIVHADIKPDNFLLGERFLENKCFDSESADHGLVLVDFGQSIDMKLFPEGTAFTAKCLTSGFQCTEMLSGKPWNYQTDYFGIAGTVYCMLFGTYMQVTNEGGVWKTNAVFRRNPHSDLWLELFHTLLNVPDCGSPPSLRSLRRRLTAVLRETYSSKLASLKSRLVVLLLENRKAARR